MYVKKPRHLLPLNSLATKPSKPIPTMLTNIFSLTFPVSILILFELLITIPDIFKKHGILKGIRYFIKYLFLSTDERNYIIDKYILCSFKDRVQSNTLCTHSKSIMYTAIKYLKYSVKKWEEMNEK